MKKCIWPIILLFLLVSCNGVTPGTSYSSSRITASTGPSDSSSSDSSSSDTDSDDDSSTTTELTVSYVISNIKSQSAGCSSGSDWIEFHFASSTLPSAATFTLAGGTSSSSYSEEVSKVYIGSNSYGDVLVVSKMSSGKYDIGLLLCPYSYNGTPYISSSRSITKLKAPAGISLSANTYCKLGSIGANKKIYLYLPSTDSYSATWFVSYFYTVGIDSSCSADTE